MLSNYLDKKLLNDKLRDFAKHTRATISQVFSFISFDDVKPSDDLSENQKHFICALLLAVSDHSNSFRDRLFAFKCATISKDPNLFKEILEFLRKILIDSPLYGYASQDPVTFLTEIRNWSKDSSLIDNEIYWLAENIVKEFDNRIRHSTPSFGYEVDAYSYQTGFCPCRYCEAVIRFLRNNSLKEQVFRVSTKSVNHMISVLKNDKVIAPVVEVSHHKDTQPDSELLEIMKKEPLHSRMTRSIIQQVEGLRKIMDEISPISSEIDDNNKKDEEDTTLLQEENKNNTTNHDIDMEDTNKTENNEQVLPICSGDNNSKNEQDISLVQENKKNKERQHNDNVDMQDTDEEPPKKKQKIV